MALLLMFFCVFCAGQPEDCDHLFRKCKEAKNIWETALGREVTARLERLDWDDWLHANLLGDCQMGLTTKRPSRFAIRVWWI